MRILKSLILAAALTGAPAMAQQAISDAGKKAVAEYQTSRTAELRPLLQKKRALQAQFDALMSPQNYDEAKLQATTAEMKQVEGQLFDVMSGSMLKLLKSLPAQDRALFMKSLTKSAPGTAAADTPLKPGPGR